MAELRSYFFALLFALAYCDNGDVNTTTVEIKEEDDVLVVTTKNWDNAVTGENLVLVEFYAPWCGHCQSLAPEYAKAAKQLKDEKSEIKLAKVDATVEKDLAEKYGVQGFPTIKFFKKGVPIDFSGGRTGEEIVKWLMKKTGPSAKSLDDHTHKSFIAVEEGTKRDIVCVGTFFGESEAKTAFLDAADGIEGMEFGIIPGKEGEKEGIAIHKSFDNGVDGPVIMDGDLLDKEAIKSFVNKESVRLLTEFSDETAPKIFGGDIKNHLLAFVSKKADDFTSHKASLVEAAKHFKGEILFVYIDTDVGDNERILEFFNLKKGDVPTMRIIDLAGDMRKFVPHPQKAGLDAHNITTFAHDFKSGVLKPHLNSQEQADDWDKEFVKVLVGNHFHEVVDDTAKDVFVEFYAPWCGHCKQLAPIWDKLGEAFKERDDVMIAKMDSTANEVEDVKVQSFPTLKCFTKTGEVVDYKGGRTFEAMQEFVASGCTKQDEKEDEPVEDDHEDEPEGDEHEGEEQEEDEHEGDEHEEGTEDAGEHDHDHDHKKLPPVDTDGEQSEEQKVKETVPEKQEKQEL